MVFAAVSAPKYLSRADEALPSNTQRYSTVPQDTVAYGKYK